MVKNCNRHFRQFYGKVPFLEVENNVKFTGKTRKLMFPEFPVLHFNFDVFSLKNKITNISEQNVTKTIVYSQ